MLYIWFISDEEFIELIMNKEEINNVIKKYVIRIYYNIEIF